MDLIWLNNKERIKKVAFLRNAFFRKKMLPRLGGYRIAFAPYVVSRISISPKWSKGGVFSCFVSVLKVSAATPTSAPKINESHMGIRDQRY